MPHLLLLEDDENIAFEIQEYLQKNGHEITVCATLAEAKIQL